MLVIDKMEDIDDLVLNDGIGFEKKDLFYEFKVLGIEYYEERVRVKILIVEKVYLNEGIIKRCLF